MGRVRRKLALAAPVPAVVAEPLRCALCDRELGARIEWHHLVPKSEGGIETVPLHPICHRTIHATLTNVELVRGLGEIEALRAHPALARFIAWVADKPPDFHAPTRRAR